MRYIFNASGECKLYYNNSVNNANVQKFTATSSGDSCKNAYKALKNALKSNVKNYLRTNNFSMIKLKFCNFTCVQNEIPKLQLYYNLVFKDGVIINQEELTFIPYEQNTSTYSGLANQKMSNKDGTPNNNIISFTGYRTSQNEELNLPPLYQETISILMEDGSYINAEKLYIDSGTSFASTTPYTIYDTTGASGIFSNFKQMKIIFNNSNPNLFKRTIQFF